MFFKKNNKSGFESARDEINKLLKKKDFDLALARFSSLSEIYDKLKLTKKIEFEEDYSLIRDQLILYMKSKEMDFLIRSNDLDDLRNVLLFIEEKTPRIKNGALELLEYVNNEYNNCLGIYHAMVHKEEFDDNLNQLYLFLEREEYEEALKLFPGLFKALEDVNTHAIINPSFYEELRNLKKDVELKILKRKAYGKFAEVDTNFLRNKLKKKIK